MFKVNSFWLRPCVGLGLCTFDQSSQLRFRYRLLRWSGISSSGLCVRRWALIKDRATLRTLSRGCSFPSNKKLIVSVSVSDRVKVKVKLMYKLESERFCHCSHCSLLTTIDCWTNCLTLSLSLLRLQVACWLNLVAVLCWSKRTPRRFAKGIALCWPTPGCAGNAWPESSGRPHRIPAFTGLLRPRTKRFAKASGTRLGSGVPHPCGTWASLATHQGSVGKSAGEHVVALPVQRVHSAGKCGPWPGHHLRIDVDIERLRVAWRVWGRHQEKEIAATFHSWTLWPILEGFWSFECCRRHHFCFDLFCHHHHHGHHQLVTVVFQLSCPEVA